MTSRPLLPGGRLGGFFRHGKPLAPGRQAHPPIVPLSGMIHYSDRETGLEKSESGAL